MTKKFKVGDRVRRVSEYHDEVYLGTIIDINSQPSYKYLVKWDTEQYSAWTADELVPIQPEVQEPVVEGPIPGKFYRTRGGDKVFYIGKDNYGYCIYQGINGEYLRYQTAYLYYDKTTDINDVVGKWVDTSLSQVLPAMEVKSWGLVVTTEWAHRPRGFVYSAANDTTCFYQVYAKEIKEGVFKIVELTGTLPERKI